MQALRQFRARSFQSFLLVVSIALGVAVVTAGAAYLDISLSQQRRAQTSLDFRQVTIMDAANAHYWEGATAPVHKIRGVGEPPLTLKFEDLEAARLAAPSVDYAYLVGRYGWLMTTPDGEEDSFDIGTVTYDYLEAADIQVTQGDSFTRSDFDEVRRVMLITPKGAKARGFDDPIGKTVSTPDGITYTIIGILPDSDDPYAPLSLAPFDPKFEQVYTLTFAVKDVGTLAQARSELDAFARETWGERAAVVSESLQAVAERTRVSVLFTAIFASLGLVIAAITVMSLFVARTLRRQHELAVLRSLGASRADVRNLVLGESLVLGLVGGAAGVGAGYLLTAAFNRYASLASGEAWSGASVSPLATLSGLGLALLLSLLFGLYPALLASSTRITEGLKEV